MDIKSKDYLYHTFPMGKHKDQRISECYDLNYLEWLFEMAKLNDKTREVIALRIHQLSNPKAKR